MHKKVNSVKKTTEKKKASFREITYIYLKIEWYQIHQVFQIEVIWIGKTFNILKKSEGLKDGVKNYVTQILPY